MKHRVTVEVETKRRFLGIPYTVTEKKKVTVNGKTYREMKRAERDRKLAEADEAAAATLVVLEEELSVCD